MFKKNKVDKNVDDKNYKSDIKFALKYARILLNFTGSWPVHKQHWTVNILRRFYNFLGCSLALLVLVFLIIETVFSVTDLKKLFKKIGLIFVLVVGLLKFFIIMGQSKNVRKCIEQMHVDWKETDSENRKIMLEYCKMAHSYTFNSTCFMYFCVISWHVKQVLKELNIIDGRSAYGLTYPADFILFNSRFVPLYYIELIQLLGSSFDLMCMMNTLAISVSVVMHICAQYKIITTKLETFGKYNESGGIERSVDMFPIIIKRHNHLLRFSTMADRTFEGIFFTEWINCSNGVWLCGYLFITDEVPNDKINDFMGLMNISYMFYIFCDIGESFKQQGDDVGTAFCSSEWYNLPRSEFQKILMTIQISQFPHQLSAGKVIKLSMKTFCVVIKRAFQFMSLLNSVT